MAGFDHVGLAEIDHAACETLRQNRPEWNVVEGDLRDINGTEVDLFAGGVPCPPFSVAGKQMGADDDRDMFPAALHLIEQVNPRAVMLENVPGFASAKFEDYRNRLFERLGRLGYVVRSGVV